MAVPGGYDPSPFSGESQCRLSVVGDQRPGLFERRRVSGPPGASFSGTWTKPRRAGAVSFRHRSV